MEALKDIVMFMIWVPVIILVSVYSFLMVVSVLKLLIALSSDTWTFIILCSLAICYHSL